MSKEKYAEMQKNQYDATAISWSVTDRDHVVGCFDQHNNWSDYDNYLFKNIDTKGKIALDFGCGPARSIVKFANQFQRIDGVDISDINLRNAKIWCEKNNISFAPNLFMNNGLDLSCITTDNYYDVIFSTICMQHICVHETRFAFLKEFYRLLKIGGSICIQMGFGTSNPKTVDYYDNFYDAPGTNSMMDTRVENPIQLQSDLEKIGFINFEYDIRPVGPGDSHTNWIFFRATK